MGFLKDFRLFIEVESFFWWEIGMCLGNMGIFVVENIFIGNVKDNMFFWFVYYLNVFNFRIKVI